MDIPQNQIIIGIIIVLLILIIYIQQCNYQSNLYKIFMNGFWKASNKFCHDACLDTAAIWINTDERSMYMIMDKGSEDGTNGTDIDNELLLNKITSYKLRGDFLASSADELECSIIFEDDIDPIPHECKLRISLENGSMALIEDDTMILLLYKDNEATCNTV